MLTRPRVFSRPSLLCMTLSACLAGPLAMAAGADGNTDIQARYKADVERCNTGQTNQDKATCLQEAGAALEEARRNRLTDHSLSTDNQTKRCEALPVAQRDDCVLQMSGQNTTVHGSVAGGGVLRETTITVPAETLGNPTPGAAAPGLVPAPTTAPAPTLAPAPAPAPSLAPAPSSTPVQPYTPATLPGDQ